MWSRFSRDLGSKAILGASTRTVRATSISFTAGIASLFFLIVAPQSTATDWPISHRPATIVAITRPQSNTVTVELPPRDRNPNSKPYRFLVDIADNVVFRQLPTRRKVSGTFADIAAGQRIVLSALTSSTGNTATEVVILAATNK
jgi:hypothetical protein